MAYRSASIKKSTAGYKLLYDKISPSKEFLIPDTKLKLDAYTTLPNDEEIHPNT